jgi:Domain of unknown function (DUF4185)
MLNERGAERSLAFSAMVLIVCTLGCNKHQWKSSHAPAALSIVRLTNLGTIPASPVIRGRSGAYSALFQGNSVWLYTNTFLTKPDSQGRTLISDSWSLTPDLNGQDGISEFDERLDSSGAPTMILPETPAEEAFNEAHNINHCTAQPCGAMWALWPSSIVVSPDDKGALVFYSVVTELPGNFNFQGIGSSVASWQNLQQRPHRPSFSPPLVASHPDLMFRENEPSFGTTAFMLEKTVYIYGCGVPTAGLDKGCRLAKVELSKAQDRSAWTFYAGQGMWSSQVSDAVSVFNGNNNLSASWNDYVKQYVAVYSKPFSDDVILRTSPTPEGPWSGETTVFRAMKPVSGNVYDAHSHPEYDHNGGQTIFITYSRQTAPFCSEVRLVSLTLQRSASSSQ